MQCRQYVLAALVSFHMTRRALYNLGSGLVAAISDLGGCYRQPWLLTGAVNH